jgi:PQQ-dependent catabolism-associated CXXCW motif protein
VPGLSDGQSYLLPVDAPPDAGETQGYPLKLLYANLEKSNAKTITIVLDACFAGQSGSGEALIPNASVMTRPSDPAPDAPSPRLTVITASAANQLANWDEGDAHGLFTEYFLRGVYGAADDARYGAGNGTVTVAALHNYLDDTMTLYAGRELHRDQSASVTGNTNEVLAAFEPGHFPIRPKETPPVQPAIAVAPVTPPSLQPAQPARPGADAPPAAAAQPPVSAAADAMLRQGLSLRQQGRYDEAMTAFRAAADSNSAAAMSAIGDAYSTGHGAPKDMQQALVWYRRAAALGDAYGINVVGYIITTGGAGLTPDPVTGLLWYRRAAELGNTGGLNNLAYAYWRGQGTDANMAEALRLFRQSAEMGNAISMLNLGDIFSSAEWGQRDDAAAAQWYRKAADLGNPRGMYELGNLYRYGRVGGRVDLVIASQWLRSAADAGWEPAKKALAEVQTAMNLPATPPQPTQPAQPPQLTPPAGLRPAAMPQPLPQPLPQPQPAPQYSGKPQPEPQPFPQPVPAFAPAPGFAPPTAAMAEEAALNLTPASRYALQGALAMLGYQPGMADGEFGQPARAAIAAFQQRSFLPSTGFMTRTTRDKLVEAAEHAEWGIPPQRTLQNNVGSRTPSSIPALATRVIYTPELVNALRNARSEFVIIDAWRTEQRHPMIPGAIWLPNAGSGGGPNDFVQRQFAADLYRATNGRRDVALVFTCQGPECWESYNAALRAMWAGYERVLWYRGGMLAWNAAGEPTQ